MTSPRKLDIFQGLFVVVFAVTLGFSVVNPFFSVYVKTLTERGLFIALVFSGFFLAKVIFTPFLCRRSDFADRRIFIFAGLVLHTIVAFFFFLLPENVFFIIVLRFLQGVATAMVRPVAQAIVGDISPENHEGTSMGTFDVSFYIAAGIGPLLGGAVGDIIGYRGIFGILLLLCFIALLVLLATMRGGTRSCANHIGDVKEVKTVFENPRLQGLFPYILTRSFGIVIMPVFLPLLLYTRFHTNHLEIGICIAAGPITTALLLRGTGKLSDRWNRKTLVAAGGVASGLFMLCVPLVQSFWLIVILCVLLACSSALSLPASTALLVEEGRVHGLGYTMGLFHTAMNIGFFLGLIIAGLLMDTLGISSIFFAAGLLVMLGTLFFVLRLHGMAWEL